MEKSDRTINGWLIVTVLLVIIIIAGGVYIGLNYESSGPVEISLIPTSESISEVYISGDVTNPGYYDVYQGDDIEGLIAAAGGVTGDAGEAQVELNITEDGSESSQLININTAEAWLLESLPGIGEVKARAIVDYRETNGHFRYIQEIMEVEGIGPASFESIRHLITVAE